MAVRNPLENLFGKSPIRPIQEHMLLCHEAGEQLAPFFEASQAGEWETAKQVHRDIARMEREADKLKNSVRRNLPKSLFLPVPRGDLLELVSVQDRIANRAQDISGMVLSRKMQFPEKLQEPLLNFVDSCTAASFQALRAIQELDELLEVGFTGREVLRVEEMLKELDKLERTTDKLGASLSRKLFKLEASLPPVDVMFMYRVIDDLGRLADHAEKAGHRLQVLIAR